MSLIKEKSYAFACSVVKTYKEIRATKKEFYLSGQLLRSGTSIAANLEEALGGQSKKDFIAKLSISYKEARESSFWINLLAENDFIETQQAALLKKEIASILKILASIIKTTKQKNS